MADQTVYFDSVGDVILAWKETLISEDEARELIGLPSSPTEDTPEDQK